MEVGGDKGEDDEEEKEEKKRGSNQSVLLQLRNLNNMHINILFGLIYSLIGTARFALIN